MTKWLIDQVVDLERTGSAWAGAKTVLIVPGDAEAHAWRARVTVGGEAADLSGYSSASGSFTRADGERVIAPGAIDGNVVTVILPAAACAVSGPVRGVIRLSDGEKVLSLGEANFLVSGELGGDIVDPEGLWPDAAALAAAYDTMRAATSAAQAAAQAGTGAARALGPYNCLNLLALTPPSDSQLNGISYTWDGDECLVEGTATRLSICNVFLSYDALPFGMEPGRSYRVKYHSTSGDVWFQIRFMVDGVEEPEGRYFIQDGTITVPAGAMGARMRLGVSAGKSVEERVSPRILTGLTNDEIDARIDARIDGECFIARGVLTAGKDLDDVVVEGHYLLNSNWSYINAPYPTPAEAGAHLEVLRTAPNTILQRVTVYATGETFMRQSSGGSFQNRVWVALNTGRRLEARYVAFGDSLTVGAVWNSAKGDTGTHRVKEAWRIPTRIARAVGAGINYRNEGVSGIGYVHRVAVAEGGETVMKNLVDLICGYSFAGVGLVTVMGGANDKLKANIPLGSVLSAAGDGSICGAIKAIIAHIRQSEPRAQVVIIQPTPSGIAPPGNDWTARGAGGWSMDDFDRAVSALCRSERVGYVSWNGCGLCEGWNTRNEGWSYQNGPNYTHPIRDFDYCALGDYIAGRVAAYAQEGMRIPEAPAEDGRYRLVAVVEGGRMEMRWEREEG